MFPKETLASLGRAGWTLACAATLAAACAASAADLKKLPEFSLPDCDGKQRSSSEFKGKPVLVDFWASWCNTCKETVPKLAELAGKYQGKGLVIIGISEDKGSIEKVMKAAKKLGITYLVLHDKENALGNVFGFSGIPSLYLFDRMGNLSTALPGYDPDQEKQLEEAASKVLN